MIEKNIIIDTEDNVSLSATLFLPKEAEHLVLISSATGIKRSFYFDFARFLCEKNTIVLTFDYRGIGDSKKSSQLREIRMSDWAIKDVSSVLYWLDNEFELPIYLLGHSIGSQLLSLVKNNYLVKKALFVGTNHGYWRNLPTKSHPKTLLFSLALTPFLSLFHKDSLPLKKKGLGVDLPTGVAREFSTWLLNKNYYFDLLGQELPDYRNTYNADTTILVFEDDELNSVDGTYKFVEQARIKDFSIEIVPASIDKKIGHFGMFKKQNKNDVWDKMSSLVN